MFLYMEEKCLIGIDYCGIKPVIGSVVMAQVILKPDFFRKYSWLKLNNLDRLGVNKIFDNTRQRLIDFRIKPIEPKFMKGTDMKDLLMVSLIELLNSQHKFWKNSTIYIKNFDESIESFEERLDKFLPKNLKEIKDDLNINKWHIGDDTQKVSQLASIYARYHSSLEHNEIKSIWGDFGTGLKDDPKTIQLIKEHPDCPHIR